MGCTAEIHMSFPREKHARWARHVAEEMIKILYAPKELPWVQEAEESCSSLSRRYLQYRRQAAAMDFPPPDPSCALYWLRRARTHLVIERCADLMGWTGIECEEDLFPQLCYAYALRFPQVPFEALYRYEMTVSGSIQLIRVQYDGAVMHIQEKAGERPMDEDDWSRDLIHDYIAVDGVFTRQRTVDPMREVKERRSRAIAESMDELRRRCRPLLVALGGSIAYGLDTPESDVDLRGIFLNPPEELIGLRPEQESIRLDGSDTLLYGLRRAMKLLMDCNPNVVELLGLRPGDIVFCSEEGRMILDSAPVFLSQRAIRTFGGYAVKLRRQIEKQRLEGVTDAKALAKEMMHLLRLYTMGADLLLDGYVTTSRRDHHGLLMAVRRGEYQDKNGMPTAAYGRMLSYYTEAFERAAERTALPAEPDWEKANALTMEIVRRAL